MSFQLLVAPPGAGKTTYLLEHARDLTQQGKRVWWVGLPSQRSYLYRRATEHGALLGLEFLSAQQVYYRLLANALALKPLLVGTGRLARVAEALLALRRELPAPGEARLFAYAIAEAKRYGVTPSSIRPRDEETDRFRRVYAAYEGLKGEAWDYDDFRTAALALAQRADGKLEADAIIVDGLRELGPLELRLYRELARRAEVWVALPEAPPGESPSERLPPRQPPAPAVFRAANPVVEARWVLRSLKRDLAAGIDPLELAVILPEARVRAFVALADEYGVPVMDETPKALADTLPGRLLMDLLELPDYPTASRLLAIPELQPLANAALRRGVVGFEAISVLAREVGLDSLWKRWLGLLEVDGEEMAWAENLLERGLPAVRRELLERDQIDYPRFKEHALQRAKEASSLAQGSHFRAWWAALLQETFLFERPRGGVALLSAKLASGRRFRRAYLMHAVEGSYGVGEAEDYFVPEEERLPLETVFADLGLPRRFQGRDRLYFAELRSRAAELTITYPEADQGGPLVPEAELVGAAPAAELPELPAGSRLELAEAASYQAPRGTLKLGRATISGLQRYRDCGFRYWAERTLPEERPLPWWEQLRRDMRAFGRLNPARFEELRGAYPQAAGWLAEHEQALTALGFGVTLPEDGDGPRAYLDAAGRRGNEVTLVRFVEPEGVRTPDDAKNLFSSRWNELWAAAHLLERYRGRIVRVRLQAWPILGAPVPAFGDGITEVGRLLAARRRWVDEAYTRFARGEVEPKPGFVCRECRVFDVCREGKR